MWNFLLESTRTNRLICTVNFTNTIKWCLDSMCRSSVSLYWFKFSVYLSLFYDVLFGRMAITVFRYLCIQLLLWFFSFVVGRWVQRWDSDAKWLYSDVFILLILVVIFNLIYRKLYAVYTINYKHFLLESL